VTPYRLAKTKGALGTHPKSLGQMAQTPMLVGEEFGVVVV